MKFFIFKDVFIFSDPPVKTFRNTPREEYQSYRFPNVITSDMKGTLGLDRVHQMMEGTPSTWKMDLVLQTSTIFTAEWKSHYKAYVQLRGLEGSCMVHGLKDKNSLMSLRIGLNQDGYFRDMFTPNSYNISKTCGNVCFEDKVELPVEHLSKWTLSNGTFKAMLCIIMQAQHKILIEDSWEDDVVIKDASTLNRHILNHGTLSDVKIVSGNGSVHKAHKNILAANSSVFETMFSTDMSEARENTVEIPDMSEESVGAFLKFLYYQHDTDLAADSTVAFELYCAGHRYDIELLENKMNAIIMNKPCEWFKDVDVVLKLFLFARNLVPVNEQLKIKATKILRMNAKSLESCPTYKELFQKDASAAMELCKYAFSNLSV